MSRLLMRAACVAALAAVLPLAGCSEMMGGRQMACPGCNAQMAEGSYCASCQMMVTDAKGMVHCDKCNMDMAAGKYCRMCNAFMMSGEAKCPGCGHMMKAGAMCPTCKMYAGSKKVTYCEGCKMPCPAGGCTMCKT